MRDDLDRTIVVETVRALQSAGIRNGIITNNAREFADGWRRLIPVDELFDDVVDSSAVGLRKPNPAIYELALSRLAVRDPSATVFLDDFEYCDLSARHIGGAQVVHAPAAVGVPQPITE